MKVMVRRIKEDLRVIQGGFPKREVKQVTLEDPASEPELELFRLLSQYQARSSLPSVPERAANPEPHTLSGKFGA